MKFGTCRAKIPAVVRILAAAFSLMALSHSGTAAEDPAAVAARVADFFTYGCIESGLAPSRARELMKARYGARVVESEWLPGEPSFRVTESETNRDISFMSFADKPRECSHAAVLSDPDALIAEIVHRLCAREVDISEVTKNDRAYDVTHDAHIFRVYVTSARFPDPSRSFVVISARLIPQIN